MSHTPEPWALEELDDVPGFLIVGPEGQAVARVVRICINLEKTRSWQPEVEANARLIVTAPELLAALKKAMELIDNKYEGSSPASPGKLFMQMELVAKEARSVIAKAEGNP